MQLEDKEAVLNSLRAASRKLIELGEKKPDSREAEEYQRAISYIIEAESIVVKIKP